jgi:hypothetical protein
MTCSIYWCRAFNLIVRVENRLRGRVFPVSDDSVTGADAEHEFARRYRAGAELLDLFLVSIRQTLSRTEAKVPISTPASVQTVLLQEADRRRRPLLLLGIDRPVDDDSAWEGIDRVFDTVYAEIEWRHEPRSNESERYRRALSRVAVVLVGEPADPESAIRQARRASSIPEQGIQ